MMFWKIILFAVLPVAYLCWLCWTWNEEEA